MGSSASSSGNGSSSKSSSSTHERKNENQSVGDVPGAMPRVKSYAPHSTLLSGLDATASRLNMFVSPALISTHLKGSVQPASLVHGWGFSMRLWARPLTEAEMRGTLPVLHFWTETVMSATSEPPKRVLKCVHSTLHDVPLS